MSKRQKNTSLLIYFAKQRRKKSTEIKDHEQETNSSRPTCSTSASQSTEFDSAEERINLDSYYITSDDIAKTLPPNRSNNVDKLPLLKNVFRSIGGAAMEFGFKIVSMLKNNEFVISKKIISEHIRGWYIVFRKSQKFLLQILCYIFYVFSELWGWKKSSKTQGS